MKSNEARNITSVIISDWNYTQKYKNKTHVVINWNYPFNVCLISDSTWDPKFTLRSSVACSRTKGSKTWFTEHEGLVLHRCNVPVVVISAVRAEMYIPPGWAYFLADVAPPVRLLAASVGGRRCWCIWEKRDFVLISLLSDTSLVCAAVSTAFSSHSNYHHNPSLTASWTPCTAFSLQPALIDF